MSNTTTLSIGWKLTRLDGTVMAFTDHDNDLTIDSVTYSAATALTPSEAVTSLGMAVDEQEVQGGLNSSAITESDLSAGVYDGAKVEVIEIDWSTQSVAEVIGVYYIGQVRRAATAFAAELRSRAGFLSQRRGRTITYPCDAELGDSRCGVNVAALKQSGTIESIASASDFSVLGLEGNADGYFSRGQLIWTSGENLGQVADIRAFWGGYIHLWRSPLFEVQVGDGFDVTPGCDKTFVTCTETFSNGDNHRGFPHVTGKEGLTYAVNGDANLDGGSRNNG